MIFNVLLPCKVIEATWSPFLFQIRALSQSYQSANFGLWGWRDRWLDLVGHRQT